MVQKHTIQPKRGLNRTVRRNILKNMVAKQKNASKIISPNEVFSDAPSIVETVENASVEVVVKPDEDVAVATVDGGNETVDWETETVKKENKRQTKRKKESDAENNE